MKIMDFIQEAAYLIGEFSEDDLTGEIGVLGVRVKYDLEKAEVSGNMFCSRDIENIFLTMLRIRSREIHADQAEKRRIEREERCRNFETINHAGTMAGY